MSALPTDDALPQNGAAALPVDLAEQSATALLEYLPPAILERLARRYLSKSALRRRRLQERDELLLGIATAHYGSFSSGNAVAERLARDLTLYRSSAGWRSRTIPTDSRRAALHRILALSDGHRALGHEAIRKILAGL